MDDFEQQLKYALSRKEPPPWFEAKVLAAAASSQAPGPVAWWEGLMTRGRVAWASAALAGVMTVSGVVWQREYAERQRTAGLEAKAKLELALRVTGVKLRKIQQIVEAVQRND